MRVYSTYSVTLGERSRPTLRSSMTPSSAQADAFCQEILPAVSRTIALSIRLLPGALGAAVRDAYLLCRIADTIEDAPNRSAVEKAELLDTLDRSFDDAAAAA